MVVNQETTARSFQRKAKAGVVDNAREECLEVVNQQTTARSFQRKAKAMAANHASEKCLVEVNQQTNNTILPTNNQKLR